jgi:hypothetical protein
MSIKIDYYYNDVPKENQPAFDMREVLSGEGYFIGCFIMTINNKPVLNDYEKYPEYKIFCSMDWITWLGTQLLQSLIAFKENKKAYSYIHFLEYTGGKGLEIYLKDDQNIIINYVNSGITWYSFDEKKDNLDYYWVDEVVSFLDYKKAIQGYCEKIYDEYHRFGLPIKDSQYHNFEKVYREVFMP